MRFTVGQIARALAAEQKHRRPLMERIRHWTREGLIKPVGEKNPGTGRHRRYDENALAQVAVLDALAGLGLQIGGQREVLLVAMKSIEKWRKKFREEDAPFVYLEIINFFGQPMVRECYGKQLSKKGQPWIQPEHGDAYLFINITSILYKIWFAEGSHGQH
jgi:hypothetical protein